ncbi:efflux RND transporter periplasmic adaptor subunit [Shewanella sp. OMA3-2]|uniref:efflux RND transporter periplasmic adaptor subunit n=1 Tax=Shewanella sp. OMA3-2 TaxID=2908650 RepID=UPI001F41F82F|nr:efflux RND transporter periplasmic adaptor subunit [Shewanella sp. OMA3-2]UJF21818.1 efflux RND transporter periplasmic adaptor subunit [Shewanella sp. OMA3-2]
MKQLLFPLWLFFAFSSQAWSSNDHGHEPQSEQKKHAQHDEGDTHDENKDHDDEDKHGDDDHDEHEINHVTIAAQIAETVSIKTTPAAAGTITQTVKAYGRLTLAADNIANITARFPGVVTNLYVNIGDKVEKGQRLAQVESNDSLQTYTLLAPISGMVQGRYVNVSETTHNAPLLLITNTATLWAEIQIFPSVRSQVKVGQAVILQGGGNSYQGSITHILPPMNSDTAIIARVPINNATGTFSPNDMLAANIEIAHLDVPLVVANHALHNMENQDVVFVKEGDRYELRPVILGHSDDNHTQVLSGLEVGEQYVFENSYLIKADIEKSAAAHHH